MGRVRVWAVALPAWLALMAGDARAQVIVVGPGSTTEGDIARGYGVFFDGLGNYVLDSANARSIDTDTLIKWNVFVYESFKRRNRERAMRQLADRERNKTNFELIRRRLRENPTESDLMNGDALNVVLEELSDPKIDRSMLRLTKVPLSGGVLRLIPFQYAELGGIISMRRLTIRDEDWPLALRSASFAAEKKAYRKALDDALEQNLQGQGKLTPEAVKALQAAIARLRAKAEATISPADQTLYSQAITFLNNLGKSADLLQTPVVGAVLAEIDKYPGTTVAELVDFMQRFNLQFSPADTPSAREAYANLYNLLVKQRDQLQVALGGGVEAAPEEEQPEKSDP